VIFICEGTENKIYSNNFHVLDELKHRVCEILLSAEVSELKTNLKQYFHETRCLFKGRRETFPACNKMGSLSEQLFTS
jgi:hypothetical protein